MVLAVVDTNVVVSGVLSARKDSPNRLIVDEMLSGGLRFVISEALLIEYRRVLLRPRVVAWHGLTEAEVDAFLARLVVDAIIREPPTPVGGEPSVAGDEHIVGLLRAVAGAVLVTGDRRLAEEVRSWTLVASPAEFAVDHL